LQGFRPGLWLGSLIALNEAWYKNYPRGSFRFFNDLGEWLQMDKVGHAYSAYWMAQLSASLFQWSGVKRDCSGLWGAGVGVAYLSVIEILDGFSSQWGFSLSDMSTNVTGSALFALQEYYWKDQRIQFKFSSHMRKYSDPELQRRATQKYGRSLAERILKDYNAQTYWLSFNLKSFAPQSKIPSWLCLSVGYGADGMFGGFGNTWIDPVSGQIHDRTDVIRYRQFYLSPDIDFSKVRVKGRTPFVLSLLQKLKIKFPLPAIEFNTTGKLRGHLVYY
jgi:hypothetical protein